MDLYIGSVGRRYVALVPLRWLGTRPCDLLQADAEQIASLAELEFKWLRGLHRDHGQADADEGADQTG